MFGSRTSRIRRARLVPIALTTAALSSAVLGASVTGTLSAFQASITNDTNTATAGSLVMKESKSGAASCLSSSGTNNSYASCSSINKYGGVDTPFIPDATHATTVTIENLGASTVSSFKLTPGACTRTGNDSMSNGNLCDSLQLTLSCAPEGASGSTTVLSARTLSSLGTVDPSTGSTDVALPSICTPAPRSGTRIQFLFSVHMPSGQDNTVQGQTVSQPLTWTFTGA